MEVRLTRDSVAAGDDVESHDVSFEIDHRRKLSLFLVEIGRRSYLPGIHGGAATWVVRTGRGGQPVAVIAAQWNEPAMLVGRGAELAEFGDAYLFEYLAQEDPQAVVNRLRPAP
jgi:hypothetical protein